MVVSSHAERLKPYAIVVRYPIDPVLWFLNDRDDVRSSYYLEDVASGFDVQGLELDWTLVAWDGDFRFGERGWEHLSFKGSRWERIQKEERRKYQKNALPGPADPGPSGYGNLRASRRSARSDERPGFLSRNLGIPARSGPACPWLNCGNIQRYARSAIDCTWYALYNEMRLRAKGTAAYAESGHQSGG